MSTAALDRQLKPVYDALETGSYKSANVACTKLLKKYPKNNHLKALKALALVRSSKLEEALVLCDEVLASKVSDDPTLTAMMHVLRGLGRNANMVKMFEDAFKQHPHNEDLGTQTFYANARTGNWKQAQQIASKLFKQFHDERYLYWGIMSTVLQANDPSTTPQMRSILFKLAHRLLNSSVAPSYVSADRYYLHLTILRELNLYSEARELLESDVGKSICQTSLVCDELRRDLWRRLGLLKQEGERAAQRISKNDDRNWLEFLSVFEATFADVPKDGSEPSEEKEAEISISIAKSRQLFKDVAERDGSGDRSGFLAQVELEHRARIHHLSSDPKLLVELMLQYFDKIGGKACCFEDLKPYLLLEGDELSRWTSFLDSNELSSKSSTDVQRLINVHKLIRYNLPETQLSEELELSRASTYVKHYFEGLFLGVGLPPTELQPVDDLAILAGHAFVSLWSMQGNETYLYNAVTFLEFALSKSAHSFRLRLLLIRIYSLLGAPSLAMEHYRALNLKQVQTDTMSHMILSRASTFSLAATGDLTYITECLESSQIYHNNLNETSDYIIRAFQTEKYSQIPDFIIFEDRLDGSLQRDVVKIEHVKMRITHEVVDSELVDMELIELKFIFDRLHHDNRDFEIIPNYQPRSQPSFNEQTTLFNKPPGVGWLKSFLKVYIRAFQQASDLDDSVEAKLLIGDRPKQSVDPENKCSLKERLTICREEDLKELTPDELMFHEFTVALADWLEPYHDHIRPPPHTVLVEAAKQTELKPGHPLKNLDLATRNGPNGHGKKTEDAPPIKEPPQIITQYFEKLKARFKEVQGQPIPAVLHVATLAQEAFVVFVIETLRFKSASTVKIHKLSTLSQSIKDVRTNAISVLKEISNNLIVASEKEDTGESRDAFSKSCKQTLSLVNDGHVITTSKKVLEARKVILEGVGKGIARVCTAYP